MRYALLMYADPERTKAMTADELDEVGRKHASLRDELVPAGVMVGGAGLVLPEETTTLRGEGPAGTGPFMAGRDQLTAYYEVECETADQARDIATRLLDFHVVAVEVRRIHDRVDLQVPADESVRVRLIDAAEEVMRRHGPLNVRIDEVARLAGCSRATVYRHVADKDELVREVLARLARARAEEMAPALAGIEDPAERIAEGILCTLDAVRSEWWYRALARRDATAAVARLGGGPRAFVALTEPLVAPFVAGLAAEGRLRPGVTVADATEWLCVVTTGLLAAESAEPDARPRDAQRAFLRRFVADPLLRRR